MIPGAGADRRMYAPQLEQFPDMIVPEWLPPLSLNESLGSYAERMASRIDTSAPFVLGGVSLGGMIAQQMALAIKPEALILISTCNSWKAIPLIFRLTGKLLRFLPDGFMRIVQYCLSGAALMMHLPHKRLYVAMLREVPPTLVRWQSGAPVEWSLEGTLTMPVFQIQGAKDILILLKRVNATTVIPDGDHLMNNTHAQEINAFITECLGKVP